MASRFVFCVFVGVKPIILVRHPLAFIDSLIRPVWKFNFTFFTTQPALMHNWLRPLWDDIHNAVKGIYPEAFVRRLSVVGFIRLTHSSHSHTHSHCMCCRLCHRLVPRPSYCRLNLIHYVIDHNNFLVGHSYLVDVYIRVIMYRH